MWGRIQGSAMSKKLTNGSSEYPLPPPLPRCLAFWYMAKDQLLFPLRLDYQIAEQMHVSKAATRGASAAVAKDMCVCWVCTKEESRRRKRPLRAIHQKVGFTLVLEPESINHTVCQQ